MTGDLLLYVGSGIIFLWGAGHIVPVNGIVRGFGDISAENRRIIAMTWVAEGLFLCFIGILGFLVVSMCDLKAQCSQVVIIASAAALLVGALWTALTGSRTPVLPMKLCPIVKTIVAVCYILAVIL